MKNSLQIEQEQEQEVATVNGNPEALEIITGFMRLLNETRFPELVNGTESPPLLTVQRFTRFLHSHFGVMKVREVNRVETSSSALSGFYPCEFFQTHKCDEEAQQLSWSELRKDPIVLRIAGGVASRVEQLLARLHWEEAPRPTNDREKHFSHFVRNEVARVRGWDGKGDKEARDSGFSGEILRILEEAEQEAAR